jgi:hypothetical protein
MGYRVPRLLLASFLTTALLGCGETIIDPPGNPVGPSPGGGGGSGHATLTVRLDANCEGIVGSADISVDGVFAGTVTPGGNGLSMSVTVGDHVLQARASGFNAGPLTKNITSSGLIQVFSCTGTGTQPPPGGGSGPVLPGPVQPNPGTVTVTLHSNCTGRARDVRVFLYYHVPYQAFTLQPGESRTDTPPRTAFSVSISANSLVTGHVWGGTSYELGDTEVGPRNVLHTLTCN